MKGGWVPFYLGILNPVVQMEVGFLRFSQKWKLKKISGILGQAFKIDFETCHIRRY